LPVGPVDLDDPDAGCRKVPGQAGAVAARALHAGQDDVPELPQPARQARIPSHAGRELTRPGQPADGIERRSDVYLRVSVHSAGNGRSFFYDGHAVPFSG